MDVPALASGVLVRELQPKQRTREKSRHWLWSLTAHVRTVKSQGPPLRERTASRKAPGGPAVRDGVTW